MKLRKATEQEKEAYLKTRPVYPLYGYVKVDLDSGEKVEARVEDLRSWGKEDPQYEILCPDGYTMEDCHSLLCFNLKDVKDRSCVTAVKCKCESCTR